jgi:hypothetical protein
MLRLTPRDLTFDQWFIHHAASDLGYNGLWRMDYIVTYFEKPRMPNSPWYKWWTVLVRSKKAVHTSISVVSIDDTATEVFEKAGLEEWIGRDEGGIMGHVILCNSAVRKISQSG